MSEKLYRIKPLVFYRNRARAWSVGADYRISKREGGYVAVVDTLANAGDLTGIWPSRRRAITAAQRDYEQRLISAGVVEDVERG